MAELKLPLLPNRWRNINKSCTISCNKCLHYCRLLSKTANKTLPIAEALASPT